MAKDTLTLVKHWLKVFGIHWSKQLDSDVSCAWVDALRGYDPERTHKAFERTWKTAKYYPTVEQVIGNLPEEKRQGMAWIPPVGGACLACEINGQPLDDGREMRCACRDCCPNLTGWCQWLYSDGQFCARFERGVPYCGKHFALACEHYDITALNLIAQTEYLLDRWRAGTLLFATGDENPALCVSPVPEVHSWPELKAQLERMASTHQFSRREKRPGLPHTPRELLAASGK